MKIYLGADHGGYKLKEEIKKWLKEWHMEAIDVGAFRFDSKDDYPDFAWALGQKVGTDAKSFGVLACRSGQGECIVANKVRGVRAALCWNEKSAHAARNDDNANVLCLPADYVTVDLAKKIVHTFLTTKFDESTPRFSRRLNKVKNIDVNL